MSTATDVTNTSNQPFLTGLLFPVAEELDVDECKVTGELPKGLRGAFIQNGPNPRFEPLGRYHMFDGDGMLHRLSFEDGKACYRNRWIQTRALKAEIKQGRALYHGLSEMTQWPDPELVGDAGPIKNPANTHIVRHAGRYLALWEGGPPTEIRPDLGTVDIHDFDGKLVGGMTAHPRLDPRTGEMFAFAYSPFPPFLRYFVIDAQGNLVHSIEIDIPHSVMMHDFLITEDYTVFLDSPICFNMEAMTTGGETVEWRPEYGTRLGVMPRMGQPEDVTWYEVESGHVQHFWNAWQNGDRIELSGSRLVAPNFGMQTSGDLGESTAKAEAGRPTRYWIDLARGEAGLAQFDDMQGDFCRFNDELDGVRSRYHYMSGFYGEANAIGQFDTVVKYDDQTDARTRWHAGEGHCTGEAVYVDDPSRPGEDAGWLLCVDHDAAKASSDLCILDAQNVEAGPLARVHMPQRLAFGFHVNWFPAED